MKTVFFDVHEYEEDFIISNMPECCSVLIFKEAFHEKFDEILPKIEKVEVLSVFTSSRVSADALKKLPSLKLIVTRSTGYSHINIDYCRENNIPVLNVPRYGDTTVAEFAFGLLLNVTRKISVAHESLRKGIINAHQYIGLDLNEKTIGVIGTGAIGAHAIKIAKGFGMKILAYDPFPKDELIEKYDVNYVTLDELYAHSDFITIHAPATKANYHMIDDEAFSKMKRGVVLINTARGEIINTEALYRALKTGIVRGAGLDVLECEDILAMKDELLSRVDCINPECLSKTLINQKFLELNNVIVTPHVAFDTQEAIERILTTTFKNINSFIKGEVINRVN